MKRFTTLSLLAALLAGCASTYEAAQAPVETRNLPRRSTEPAPPGYHRIQPGDTLVRIADSYRLNWRELARWNQLADPNQLEAGGLLRVTPPANQAVAAARAEPAPQQVVVKRIESAQPSGQAQPLQPTDAADSAAAKPAPATNAADSSQPSSVARAPSTAQRMQSEPAPGPTQEARSAARADGVVFAWPVKGELVATFDGKTSKGIGIGGDAGTPVAAAAAGRVVYAGSGLRGYGNLVILKHNDTLLTAYAHNQVLLVKEDQEVTQGQVIAQMGSSDADRVKLHFEIRRLGKPVDPLAYLPTP